jgi:hypothetical protein
MVTKMIDLTTLEIAIISGGMDSQESKYYTFGYADGYSAGYSTGFKDACNHACIKLAYNATLHNACFADCTVPIEQANYANKIITGVIVVVSLIVIASVGAGFFVYYRCNR